METDTETWRATQSEIVLVARGLYMNSFKQSRSGDASMVRQKVVSRVAVAWQEQSHEDDNVMSSIQLAPLFLE
jgi:hypothetical protein